VECVDGNDLGRERPHRLHRRGVQRRSGGRDEPDGARRLPHRHHLLSDTSGGAYDPATGLWSIPTLANGSTATLRITATVDAGTAGTTITNTVAVTGSDQDDPNPDNNAAQATVTVGPRANRPPTPVVPDGDANLVPVDHLTDNIPLGGTPKPLHLVDPDGDAFTVNVLTG